MKFTPIPSSQRKIAPRGFVLSFALFILALYIVIYAQLQAGHLHELRANEFREWQQFRVARLAADATQDLNPLLDQQLSLDQNTTGVNLSLHGSLPSDLNLYTNLRRYQTSLASAGADSNLLAVLDLNYFVVDLNLVGRTDNNFVWKQPVNTSRLTGYAEALRAVPQIIDINVVSNQAYHQLTSWSLGGSGDTFIRFHFEDTNSGHDFTSSGWGTKSSSYTYSIDFNSIPSARFQIQYGAIDGNNGSLRIDNNNTSTLKINYSIRWQFAGDSNNTRAGYDLPLAIYSNDANTIEATQWVYD